MAAGGGDALPVWSDANPPVQLVAFDESKQGAAGAPKLIVKEDAKRTLLRAAGDRAAKVVAVCGLYRTGKSLLLNLLAGNTQRDREHDARLFALAVLLSSFLVFNSRGVLDERAVQALAMAASLAQHIHKQHKDATAGVHPAPLFLWTLRDFALALEDTMGRPITEQEYLERTLTAPPAAPGGTAEDAKRSEGAREAREKIKDLFPQRDCATLVRPVEDEEQLQRLSQLSLSAFRPKFVEQVNALREKVLRGSSVLQSPSGKAATCGTFLALLEAHVEVMNTGGVPELGSVWTQVSQQECSRALDEALNVWAQKTFQVTASLPMSDEDLKEMLTEGEAAAREKFSKVVLGESKAREEAEAELTSDINKSVAKIRKDNETAASRRNEAWLRTRWETRIEPLLKEYHKRHESGGLAAEECAEAEKQIQAKVAELRSEYAVEAVGPEAARSKPLDEIVERQLQAALREVSAWQQRSTANEEADASAKRAAEEERERLGAEGQKIASQVAKEVEESKARTAKLEAERRAGNDGVQDWDAGDLATADPSKVELHENGGKGSKTKEGGGKQKKCCGIQ